MCCVFLVTSCGSTVSNNCTYVQNPSYPSSYSTSGTCSYSVSPLNDEICQLRLDFDTLDLTESTAGACTDSFDTTTSSGRDYHSLCGTLSGQHGKLKFNLYSATKLILIIVHLQYTLRRQELPQIKPFLLPLQPLRR